MAFDSNDEFDQHLCRLRSDINDLRLLRPPTQHTSVKMEAVSDDSKSGFNTVPTVQKAFKALSDMLVNAWSCDNRQHQEHSLCLDLGVDILTWEHVRSNLALTYQESSLSGHNAVDDSTIRHLLLETKSTKMSQRNSLLTSKKGNATMCEYLAECTCAASLLRGRLSTIPNDYQTNLYHNDGRCTSSRIQALAPKDIRLHEVLDWFQDPIDKYELAHQLATAILHLHATPWIPSTWRLSSVTALRCDEPFEVIQTLSIAMPLSVDMDHTRAATARDMETYYSAGVQNATLFNLGLALLEIEHEISLEAFKSGKKLESKSDFDVARRMAMEPDTLAGRRYRLLARKCLNCTFHCEEFDLAREDLQHAVYGDVVYKLKELAEN